MAEGFLHVDEKSSSYWDRDCHRAQLDQDMVPLIHSNPILSVGHGKEDLSEAVLLLWGQ